ncbi:MAG TPA: restriction endonuclease [Candidatus Dormibacteraeota bacterium]|nr:restriction endonuclease [Candidatus Dormibacteraeota bacterium]
MDPNAMLAPPTEEKPMPVWGDGERPSWLAPEDQQPKKREWSPVRDRMEAELELRARLEEQRRLRVKQRYRWLKAPFTWTFSLIQAVVSVSRERGEVPTETPIAPAPSSSTILNTLPPPRAPGEAPPAPAAAPMDQSPAVWEAIPETEWRPPSREPEAAPEAEAGPAVTVEPEAPDADEEPGVEPNVAHPEVDWSQPPPARTIQPAPYRAPPAPDKDWRPQAGPTPAWEAIPEVEPEPAPPPAPAPPVAPAPVEADELARVILGTCVRTSGAEVGILALLQDDVLVVRASSGIDAHIAGRLALDTLSDICLDVISSGQSFTASTNQPAPDPDRPSAILCVPVLLSGTGVGAVLLLAYAPDRSFSPDQERLVRALADVAGPELSAAGAYRLSFDQPGVLWRRLDAPLTPTVAPTTPPSSDWLPAAPAPAAAGQPELPALEAAEPEPAEQPGPEVVAEPEPQPEPPPPPPPTEPISLIPPSHRTMTLDPEMVKRLIAEAKAAREAEEAAVAAETALEQVAEAMASETMPAAPVVEEQPAPTEEMPAPAPAATPEPARTRPPQRDRYQIGWRTRVQSRMTRVSQQKQAEAAREREEILAAIRNLSWEGYQALIADIFRRKAFEVLPPPDEGSDLDVIDLVVNRDDQRMLVNCQLRGEMDIPIEAVTEMSAVVYNYSVAGAYLIADGSFAPEASAAATSGGIVLVDGNALIDLTIETTLKDERKASFTGRIAKRFSRAK